MIQPRRLCGGGAFLPLSLLLRNIPCSFAFPPRSRVFSAMLFAAISMPPPEEGVFMRSPRKGFAVTFAVTSAMFASVLVVVVGLASDARAEITLQDRTGDSPLVLSQPED